MTKTNLATTIDAWGVLKAQMAELEVQDKAFKAAVADLEPGAYEGELYRLSITMPERDYRDEAFKERIEKLITKHVSDEYVKAHTETRASRTHKLAGRNGKKLAAS